MANPIPEAAPDFLSGEKFKGYEGAAQTFVDGPFAALRVDGKGFSRFTKRMGYAVPYDPDFMEIMDCVARDLLLLVDGSAFAYVQSDEVSVIFTPTGSESAPQWWFGGKLQKLISISAARASVSFLKAEQLRSGELVDALFDSRVLSLQSAEEAEQYLRWRRFDAQKNSVSMAASSMFSHRELQGVSTRGRAALLAGTELEVLPEGFFNGRLIYRTKRQGLAWDSYAERDVPVERTVVATSPATRGFVERALPSLLANRSFTESSES